MSRKFAALFLLTCLHAVGQIRLAVTGPSIIFSREPTIELRGTAIGIAGIFQVSWSSNYGFSEQAVVEPAMDPLSLDLTWSTAPIPLRAGPNRIRIRALDRSNEAATSSVTVYYSPEDPVPAPKFDIRSSVYRGRPVTYLVKDGKAIYQGDIVLGSADALEAARVRGAAGADARLKPKSATIGYSVGLWPAVSGVAHVPYTLSANTMTSTNAVNRINSAISTFNSTFSGVIQWIPRTSEANYAVFDLTPSDHSGTCESNVGVSGGAQIMGGSIDCATPTFLHEMGHASGLWHEQSRMDRDTYVNIIYANVDKPLFSNFDKVLDDEVDSGLYDYASIMHYFAFEFSKWEIVPTLESIPAGIPLTSMTYSSGDIDGIKRLYGHTPALVTIDTNPTGGQVIVDGTTVSTPMSFNWSLNSTHTLDLPADPQTIAGQVCIFGRWNDSAGTTRSHTITISPGNGTVFQPGGSPGLTVYVANFIPLHQYALSPSTTHGTGTVNPLPSLTFAGKNYFTDRQLITLQATPNSNFGFMEWFSTPWGFQTNPNSFYVEDDLSAVQPFFVAAPVLTVASTFPGFPASDMYPPIAVSVDGNSVSTPATFGWSSAHTINGTPGNPSPVTTNISYAFANWSDGLALQHSVSPQGNANQTITATYTPTYRAIVSPSPFCGGSVTPSEDEQVVNGSTVTYTAVPHAGFAFVGWSQDLAGTTNPLQTTVNDELLATANFNVTGTTAPINITSFTPASKPTSAGAFDLVVHGTGFTAGTQAFWGSSGNSFRSSTFNNSTQVTIHLIAGDLATAGYFQVVLQNFASSCGADVFATYAVTTANNAPALTVAKSHTGNFTQGQQNATYTVLISNAAGAATTSGAVTVTETLPSGLALVSMTGTGWTCATNTCWRNDGLVGSTSYPAITVVVNVAANASSPLVNMVTASGGGSPVANASDSTVINANPPVLKITKSHVGNFLQAQQGATYTVTVSNTANAGATSGTVTVTETVPSGLSLVAMSGTGWTCVGATCTRSDVVAGGASYPAITVTVNVGATAPSPQVNQVSVSGGGSVAANATNSTIITLNPPVLTISKSHNGNFSKGQQNAAYLVTVSNTLNAGPTNGTVTVTETAPSGMTLVSMSGTGWACSTNTCNRTDALAGGASFPPITVLVNVAANAASTLVNQVGVSGGGSTSANASDSTVISANPPVLSIGKSHSGNFSQGQQNATYAVIVAKAAGSGPTTGTVTVTETVPAGLTLASMSGTGWTCQSNTCTRNDVLAAGSSYPAITVKVNVSAAATSPQVNQVSVSGGSTAATVNANDSTVINVNQPTLALSRTSLNFGYNGALVSSAQSITLSFTNGFGVAWTASSNKSNIVAAPASGIGNGTFAITVTPGTSGLVTVTAPGATGSPAQIQVNVQSVTPGNPFGSFDTPVDGTTGIAGAIAVTGWALDNIEVKKVDVWREPVPNEAAGNNGLVYIGDAVFVAGARPDVESANPTAPFNYRAGWGYLMLTNELPNGNGSPGIGNGTYRLHAIAHNAAGASLDLGTRTITVDNAHASRPFGSIDTPSQGGTISGPNFVNFGWAVTQNPFTIPLDGSTITVIVDGQTLGHPTYNQFRSDIANSFPGLANSNGAVGYFFIDTTTLANGVHTISWVVYDNAGRGDGIGSRFFNIFNSGTGSVAALDDVAIAASPALRTNGKTRPLKRGIDGTWQVDIGELDHIELDLGAVSGHGVVNGQHRALPAGSSLKHGTFHWQLGAGFLGNYELVFQRAGMPDFIVRIRVHPGFHSQQY